MFQGMKSVMVFDPKDTDEQTVTKFVDWMRDNKSPVGDRTVMSAAETREYLRKREVV